MLFNSLDFMFFLPITLLVYYIVPKKIRYIWLLIASYYFYMSWNPTYILLLGTCTFMTYVSGLLLEKFQDQKKKKILILSMCIVVLLFILGYFKYFYLITYNFNRILALLGMGTIEIQLNILLPVGISFFTLQSIGYIIDVYRKEVYAERNFFKYALFLAFFPQLVAGPIERSKNLLKQLQEPTKITWNATCEGIYLVLWGLFCKIVIADRVAIIVDTVYDASDIYNGLYIVLATALFAIQVYCDFYGYSTIARGCGLFFGIRLTDNFQAPYFSTSIKEFWRRWHISLSGWFRDYMYIPLGGSRKGLVRKEGNLIAVFAVSGLWHGASFAYVVWGMLNAFYQVVSELFGIWKRKCLSVINRRVAEQTTDSVHTQIEMSASTRIRKTITTFLLIMFTWLFFRAGDMGESFAILREMIATFNWWIFFDGSIYELGVEQEMFRIMILSIIALFLVDYEKYKGRNVTQIILKQEWWFRILCIVGLVFINMVFGCYGELYDTQQFIYFQF